MAIGSLEELFTDGLRDIYYAEKQILKALGQQAKKVQSDKLRQALEHHRKETEQQVSRIEQVMQMMDEKPRAKKCPGIEGILEEGKENMEEIEDEQVLDAAIVGAAQAVEHYEIARYGTLIAWAQSLGRDDAANLLEQTLEEEKKTDKLLSELAESSVNQEAADGMGDAEEMEAGEGDEEEERNAKPRKKSGR